MREVKIKGILEAKLRLFFNFRAYCRRIYAKVKCERKQLNR